MLADYHLSTAASIVMSFRLSGFATGQANTRPGQNHPELPRVAPFSSPNAVFEPTIALPVAQQRAASHAN
jgi:hypothetical protein